MSDSDRDQIHQAQQVSQAAVGEGNVTSPAISDELPLNNEKAVEARRAPSHKPSGGSKKRTTSPEKIAANRRNSLKSTGPQTAAGKENVSKNAIKHGFFAKHLIIQDRDGKEDPAEFEQLRAAIREDCQPEGALEEICAATIVACCWRKRRLWRYESGTIAKALADNRDFLREQSIDSEMDLAAPADPELNPVIVDHLCLPPKEDADKLLRYEAMNDRQLNQALAQLERLQRRRIGDAVPPPIGGEVSGKQGKHFAKQSH
jgi:hypothetical protein